MLSLRVLSLAQTKLGGLLSASQSHQGPLERAWEISVLNDSALDSVFRRILPE